MVDGISLPLPHSIDLAHISDVAISYLHSNVSPFYRPAIHTILPATQTTIVDDLSFLPQSTLRQITSHRTTIAQAQKSKQELNSYVK